MTQEIRDQIRNAKDTVELSAIMGEFAITVRMDLDSVATMSWDEAAHLLNEHSEIYTFAGQIWDDLIEDEDKDKREEVGVIELTVPPATYEFQVCFEVVVSEYNGREFVVGDSVRFSDQEFDVVGVVTINEKQLLFAVKKKGKTLDEVEELKEQWKKDPCWDIEDTEGFEEHSGDLLRWRQGYESQA